MLLLTEGPGLFSILLALVVVLLVVGASSCSFAVVWALFIRDTSSVSVSSCFFEAGSSSETSCESVILYILKEDDK